MSNSSHAIDLIVAASQEYAPSTIAENTARLGDLGVFVTVRETQSLTVGSMSAFMSEVTASERMGEKGITVTCVGHSEGMDAAIADAVGQWCLGVLPVLAQWRGKHTCLSAPREIQNRAGSFDLLAGPVLMRGAPDGNQPPAHMATSPSQALTHLMEAARPALRAHWMEFFACKLMDGSVEATCRVNNHDWLTAQRTLAGIASAWPASAEPMQSVRQFVMMVPKGTPAHEIVLPTTWERILGRA